jgi:hypothetical protein
MKKKIKYTDGPIGKTRTVKDFLPPPSHLLIRQEPGYKGRDITLEESMRKKRRAKRPKKRA